MLNTHTRCFIGIGSNLNEPRRQLQAALGILRAEPDMQVVAVSPFYRSEAIGLEGQPDYCNAVIELTTGLAAAELLERLLAIELQQGRDRQTDQRWGPRILDMDVLLYGDAVIDEPQLKVPHPQMQHRNFVMRPLADIAPEIRVPGYGTATELAQKLGDGGLQPWPESE